MEEIRQGIKWLLSFYSSYQKPECESMEERYLEASGSRDILPMMKEAGIAESWMRESSERYMKARSHEAEKLRILENKVIDSEENKNGRI